MTRRGGSKRQGGKLCGCCTELAAFNEALKDVDNTPVDIAMSGNSILQGLATSDYANATAATLGNLLTAKWGPNTTHGRGYVPAITGGGVNAWALTNSSGSAATATRGHGLWTEFLLGHGDTMAATLTFDYLTICYDKFNSVFAGFITADNMEVYVDGNLEATIPTRDTSLADSAFTSMHQVTIGPFAETSHTVVVRPENTGLKFVSFNGAFAHRGNASAGIRVWNGGHAAYSMPNFYQNTPTSLSLSTQNSPALTIVQEMFNDRTSSNFEIRIRAMFDALVAALPDRSTNSLMYVSEYETTAWTVLGRWEDDRKIAKAVTAEYGIAYLDLGGRVGSFGNAVTPASDPCGFLGDGTHPTVAGHAYIASVYYNFFENHGTSAWCLGGP